MTKKSHKNRAFRKFSKEQITAAYFRLCNDFRKAHPSRSKDDIHKICNTVIIKFMAGIREFKPNKTIDENFSLAALSIYRNSYTKKIRWIKLVKSDRLYTSLEDGTEEILIEQPDNNHPASLWEDLENRQEVARIFLSLLNYPEKKWLLTHIRIIEKSIDKIKTGQMKKEAMEKLNIKNDRYKYLKRQIKIKYQKVVNAA